MIVSEVLRGVIRLHNLGKHTCPVKLEKGYELIWNEDDIRWEVYWIKKKGATPSQDLLVWQMSAPVKGLPITPGIKTWLQKFDTSKSGTLDLGQREKAWITMFKEIQRKDKVKRQKQLNETYYELGHICKWLGRYVEGQKQCVVPVATVGYDKRTGKYLRLYKKRSDLVGSPVQ